MNQCPDTESILAFAENPVQEKNAGIAAHIITCPACQQKYRMVMEVISMPPVPITPEIEAEAEKIAAQVIRTDRGQNKWKDTIRYICSLFEKNPFILLEPDTLPWFQKEQKDYVFAAKQDRLRTPSENIAPVIRFVSCKDENSPYFWVAELSLPSLLHDNVKIPFKVTGKGGKNIDSAKLIYLGLELPVANGKAELTVQQFKDSLNGNGISLIFEDNTIVHGLIDFYI